MEWVGAHKHKHNTTQKKHGPPDGAGKKWSGVGWAGGLG